jgi:hypothetical protein
MEEATTSICSERDSFDHGILSKLVHVKHCLHFSLVFSAQLPASRNLFSASGIFCRGRH